MDRVKEFSEEVSSKCIGEFDGPGESPKLKIYFRVVDALWISEGEAIVKSIEEGCSTSFARKRGLSDYTGSGEMLSGDFKMAEAWIVYLICGDKGSFNSWSDFTRWLEDKA